MDKVKDLDLYLLLGVESSADEATIKKAYRKKALSCHPDKNPDNPKAAELFHQLSEALSVLSDEKARKAYDNLLKAKKANELRNRELDAKRKKLKDDLEARERAASINEKTEQVLAGERLKAEIERLQREGKKQLEEEQERLREMIHSNPEQPRQTFQVQCKKLKLRWKQKEGAPKYDKENLRQIFCKYGDVGEVIIMEKEKGKFSALIEMKNAQAASLAADIESGFSENPFKKVEVIEEKSQASRVDFAPQSDGDERKMDFDVYESLVMRQMRQAEERKKLIEQMEREENDNK